MAKRTKAPARKKQQKKKKAKQRTRRRVSTTKRQARKQKKTTKKKVRAASKRARSAPAGRAKKARSTTKASKSARRSGLPLVAAAFSRDGRRLATATDGKIHVWDLAPFNVGQHAALVARITEGGSADRLALSPDGRRLAVARSGFPEVRLYDLDKSALLWSARLHAVTALAFAPDGGRIVVGDVVIEDMLRRGSARVLDAHDGALLWSSSDVDRPLRDVAFHEDGLLVLGVLGPDGVVVVWDSERSGELFRFPQRLTPIEIGERIGCSSAIAPDGSRVAFAYNGRAEVWRVDSAEKVATIEIGGRAQSLALFPDGRALATGHPTPGRWTLPHGAKAGEVQGDGRVWLSPDGSVLLAARRYTEQDGPPLQPARR
jgi:WD40 repeat protein